MQGVGGKVLRPIQGQQQLLGKDAKAAQQAVLFKTLKDLKIHPIEGTRQHRVKQIAYLVVRGNRLNAKQRTGIIVSLGVLQMALVIQKRRRLREKDTKGAQGGILDAVTGIGSRLTMVRQCIDSSVQDALEVIEASGGCHGDLLRSKGITTLTLEASFGNRQPIPSQIYNC